MSFYIRFAALSTAAAVLHMQNQNVPQAVQDTVAAVLDSKAWPGEVVATIEAEGHLATADGEWRNIKANVQFFQLVQQEPVLADPPAPVHDEAAAATDANGLPAVEGAEQPAHVEGDASALPEVEPAPEPLPVEEADATVTPAPTRGVDAEAEDPAATVEG